MQWIKTKEASRLNPALVYEKKYTMSQSKPKVTAAYEESLKSVRYKQGVKAFGVK